MATRKLRRKASPRKVWAPTEKTLSELPYPSFFGDTGSVGGPESRHEPLTKLVDKHHSPAIMRKYTKWGFPIYVALITDDDISNLDSVVVSFIEVNKVTAWVENIQKLRNLAGGLTEHLTATYQKTEGVAVVFYVDKMFISSLFGDFMNHYSCKREVYDMIAISAHI
jgi:hypothetical protein